MRLLHRPYTATSREWKYVYSAPDGREWLFDLRAAPRETHNRAGNPICAAPLRAMRAAVIERFRRDGSEEPLDGDGWRRYPPPRFPEDPDAGLLFQDARNLEQRIAELGEYGRPVTVRGHEATRLLAPEREDR